MNENLNLKEILKDCPKGTKFHSSIYGDVYFEEISNEHCHKYHPIRIKIDMGRVTGVTVQGLHDIDYKGECTLFPSKDQRDWSKWHRPFVDGDIIHIDIKPTGSNCISIYKHQDDKCMFSYIDVNINYDFIISEKIAAWKKIDHLTCRLATEEEKQLFFDVIRKKGYKWNQETKTLERLIVPKFKVGDVIQDEDGYKVKITEVNVEDEVYGYESLIAMGIGGIAFSEQNDWKSVSNKFDPNTLIPFESKVLVRDANHFSWVGSIYTHRKDNGFYTINGTYYRQCIPYNDDTAYLIGTCKIAPDYYRYWKNDYE